MPRKTVTRRNLLKGFAAAGLIGAGSHLVPPAALARSAAHEKEFIFRDDGAMREASDYLNHHFRYSADIRDFFGPYQKEPVDLVALRGGDPRSAWAEYLDLQDFSAGPREGEMERIEARATRGSARIVDPSVEQTLLVLYLRNARDNKPVAGARVIIEGSDFNKKVKLRTDAKGKITLKNLTPGEVLRVTVKRKRGDNGYFAYRTFVPLSEKKKSFDVLWLVDTKWKLRSGPPILVPFPVEFFKETTFTPILNRLALPGDDPNAKMKDILTGKREMDVYINPEFDATAVQHISSIFTKEWARLTDGRIVPKIKHKAVEIGTETALQSVSIFNVPQVNGVAQKVSVNKSGYLVNPWCWIGKNPAWSKLGASDISLLESGLRRSAGLLIGPQNEDLAPYADFPTFLRAFDDNTYSYFDYQVLPKVLFRLKTNTRLLNSTVESDGF